MLTAAVGLGATLLMSSTATPSRSLAPLKPQLDEVARNLRGTLGYCVLDLQTGDTISRLGDHMFPSASTIKTALMIEAVHQIENGELSWTDTIPLPPTSERNLSLWTYFLRDGLSINIDALVNLMMNVSDNTATVMLGEKLGLLNVERRMLELGLEKTKYTVRVPESAPHLLALRRRYQNMGVTTPNEMAILLRKLYNGELASPAATLRMQRIMSHQYWDDRIERAVPADVVVCGKTGALSRSRSDIALVYAPHPYILTVYTMSQEDTSWERDNEGAMAIVRIAELVWNRLQPERPYKVPDGFDRWLPTGGGLELD